MMFRDSSITADSGHSHLHGSFETSQQERIPKKGKAEASRAGGRTSLEAALEAWAACRPRGYTLSVKALRDALPMVAEHVPGDQELPEIISLLAEYFKPTGNSSPAFMQLLKVRAGRVHFFDFWSAFSKAVRCVSNQAMLDEGLGVELETVRDSILRLSEADLASADEAGGAGSINVADLIFAVQSARAMSDAPSFWRAAEKDLCEENMACYSLEDLSAMMMGWLQDALVWRDQEAYTCLSPAVDTCESRCFVMPWPSSRKKIRSSESKSAGLPVLLHIYDVSQEESVQKINQVLANKSAPLKFGGIFHAGVEVNGLEWSFGMTISETMPGVSCTLPRSHEAHHYRQTVQLRNTKLSAEDIGELVSQLIEEYPGDDYDLLRRSCSATYKLLGEWIESWVPAESCGGIAGRSAAYAHARLHCHLCKHGASAGAGMAAISEDLSKAFDRVNPEQAVAVLVMLGLPEGLANMIRMFYILCRRVFVVRGCYSRNWCRAQYGILQGCPWSVLLLVGLQTVWHHAVARPGLSLNSFYDDRTYWAWGRGCTGILAAAEDASRKVDKVLGFVANDDKFQSAATKPDLCRKLKEALPAAYPDVKRNLTMLGITYNFKRIGDNTIKFRAVRKCYFRLKRIAIAARAHRRRSALVRSLAFPVVTWAGCFARAGKTQLDGLRAAAATCVKKWVPKGRSRYLLWTAAAQPADDPVYAMRRNATRSLLWFLHRRRNPRAWELSLEQDYLASDPLQWSETLIRMFEEYDWKWDADNETVTHKVGNHVHSLPLAEVGLSTIDRWLTWGWERTLYTSEERLWKVVQRPGGSAIARGLVLPSPSKSSYPVTIAHQHYLAGPWMGTDDGEWALSLGTGLTGWHRRCRIRADQRRIDQDRAHTLVTPSVAIVEDGGERPDACGGKAPYEPQQAENKCMCGLRDPSMPHLLWNCSATQALRRSRGVRLPTNRAEERLLVACVPAWPARPPANLVSNQDLRGRIRDIVANELLAATREKRVAVLATDGGAKFPHCTMAFASDWETTAVRVPGEDESSYAAEVWAVTLLLNVAAQDVVGRVIDPGCLSHINSAQHFKLYVVCDNLPTVMLTSRTEAPMLRYAQWRLIRGAIRQLADNRVEVHMQWCPSHGKEWEKRLPPAELGEVRCRRLNQRADEAATACLETVIEDDVAWNRWLARQRSALAWSTSALAYAARVAVGFSNWIREGSSVPTTLS